MEHSRMRRGFGVRGPSAGVVVAVICGVVLAAASTVSAAPPVTVNSAALAEELERIADVVAGTNVATYDDSSTTQCLGSGSAAARSVINAEPGPDPLVYTTNRIVLRTSRNVTAARQMVVTALAQLDVTAEVGPIETITFPSLEGVRITKVLSVTLISEAPVNVVELARHLRIDHQTPASPDYLLSPSGGPTEWWPDGFPVPIPVGGLTPARAGAPGSGVTIAVYDTGMIKPAQSNNPPNLSRLRAGDTEVVDANGDGLVDVYYGGHETAIAGALHVIAPGSTVKAVRITDQQTGVATDVSSARRIAATLREAVQPGGSWPGVIVNAFGTQACLVDPLNPDVDMVPLGLQAVADTVDLHDQSLIVASAGNRGTDQRFYPAAFSTTVPSAVLSVGALDTTADIDQNPWTSKSRTGPRAAFSNYGDWVTAWAPGVDLPTHHVTGLQFDPTAPMIEGAALVSGTSFAGPVVAGLIAEQMARTGADADIAWAAIANKGVTCSAVNGSGVAVALTALTSRAITPPSAPRAARDC